MSIKDYEHWNEEAARVWWEEEGKWDSRAEYDAQYDYDYYDSFWLEERDDFDDVDDSDADYELEVEEDRYERGLRNA